MNGRRYWALRKKQATCDGAEESGLPISTTGKEQGGAQWHTSSTRRLLLSSQQSPTAVAPSSGWTRRWKRGPSQIRPPSMHKEAKEASLYNNKARGYAGWQRTHTACESVVT